MNLGSMKKEESAAINLLISVVAIRKPSTKLLSNPSEQHLVYKKK